MNAAESILTKNQKKVFGWKEFKEDGITYRIRADVRYDDACGNGHNTFSITGTIDEKTKYGRWIDHSGGCLHEAIAKHFPELAPFIKWHLVSSSSPMHYIANAIFLAGDKDCWGKRKGEVLHVEKRVQFGTFPFTFKASNHFIAYLEGLSKEDKAKLDIEAVEYTRKNSDYKFEPKYTFKGFVCLWHECPFDSLSEAENWKQALQEFDFRIVIKPLSYSEGKERELDAARSCAIWPEATDEELMADNLKERLEARLPQLMSDFRQAIESLGFTY